MLAHNVAALLSSPPGTTRDLIIHDPAAGFRPELDLVGPARGAARLLRTQDSIVARCDVAATVQLECSRCLEPFPTDLSVHFEEQFLPSVSIATGLDLPSAEDEALRIDEHHVLDLTEIARQYLLTAVPLNPVCAPGCLGLCPTCGANLNQGACSCAADAAPSPFSALGALFAAAEQDRPSASG